MSDVSIWVVDVLVKTSLVIASAAVLTSGLRRAAARWRHALWCVALVGTLAIPALSAVMIVGDLPMLPGLRLAASGEAAKGANPLLLAKGEGPASGPGDSGPPAGSATPIGSTSAAVPAVLPVPAFPPTTPGAWMLLAWLAGAALVLAPTVRSLVHVRRRTILATPPAGRDWSELLHLACAELSIRRRVRLLVAEDEVVPLTWGWRRPVVLLPASAPTWTPSRRRIVLMHELLHVQRHDWPLHILARVVRAAYWFNPLAWLLAARVRDESEQACDEGVVARGVRATDYADCLLLAARAALTRHRLSGGLTMAHRSMLERRITNVLNGTAPSWTRRPAAPALAALVAATLTLATMSPWSAAAAASQDPADDEALDGLASRTVRQTIPADEARLANLVGRVVLVPGDGDVRVVATVYSDDEALIESARWVRTRRADGPPEWTLDLPALERQRYARLSPGSRSTGTWNERRIEITGDPEAPTLFADLKIEVPADTPVAIRVGHGDVRGRQVEGDVSIVTNAAAVRLDGFEGALDVRSGAGSSTVRDGDLSDGLSIHTGAGSIDIAGAVGDASLNSGAGAITLSTRLSRAGRISASSGAGAITVYGEADASFEASVHQSAGRFENGYDDARVMRRGGQTLVRRGSGGAEVKLECAAGACRIAPAESE